MIGRYCPDELNNLNWWFLKSNDYMNPSDSFMKSEWLKFGLKFEWVWDGSHLTLRWSNWWELRLIMKLARFRMNGNKMIKNWSRDQLD